MIVQSLDSWFENICQGFEGDHYIYDGVKSHYKLRVMIAGYRVTPRHSTFDLLLDIGSQLIAPLLYHKEIRSTHIFFVFPERHMSVHEQHNFLSQIAKHPQAHNLERVDIVTQNPLVVGGCTKEVMRLFSIEGADGLMDNDPITC